MAAKSAVELVAAIGNIRLAVYLDLERPRFSAYRIHNLIVVDLGFLYVTCEYKRTDQC